MMNFHVFIMSFVESGLRYTRCMLTLANFETLLWVRFQDETVSRESSVSKRCQTGWKVNEMSRCFCFVLKDFILLMYFLDLHLFGYFFPQMPQTSAFAALTLFCPWLHSFWKCRINSGLSSMILLSSIKFQLSFI